MTADSARCWIGIRLVRATVPLPTGAACWVTASARRSAISLWVWSNRRNSSTASRKLSTYSLCVFSRRAALAAWRFAYASVERSCSSLARSAAMVAVGASTPRENSRRPFFSFTVQVGPAAFTRRVKPASPGGSNDQSAGGERICPSAVRTVLGAEPGETIRVCWGTDLLGVRFGAKAGSR